MNSGAQLKVRNNIETTCGWDDGKHSIINMTFVGPCIVIYFYSKINQMHNISNLFYYGNNTLHVLDGLAVHQQESKTVHTASGICHTGSVAAC
jgi:hypothetical protein